MQKHKDKCDSKKISEMWKNRRGCTGKKSTKLGLVKGKRSGSRKRTEK